MSDLLFFNNADNSLVVSFIFLCYIKTMKRFSEMSFFEIVENIDTLKTKYDGIFVSFFWREKVKKWRLFVYSFNIKETQKDRIWEYLNNDIELQLLQEIAGFEKKHK